jgi:hypothetical protein
MASTQASVKSGQPGRADSVRLGAGVDAADHEQARGAEAVGVRDADLGLVGGRESARTTHFDAVGAGLGQRHAGEVAHHVGQDVGTRIADLVEHLLAHGRGAHQPAGARWLGDDEAAVSAALGDRKAHVVPAGHALPVGVVAAGGLRAAFDQVPGQAALRELVEVVGRPAEVRDQRRQRHRAVHAAAGDDDVGARGKRRRDRERAEVGVGAHHLGRERRAGEHLLRAGRAQRLDLRHQVVAEHRGDLQLHALGLGCGDQGFAAGRGVDPAGVGDDADAARLELLHQRLDGADEIGRVAQARILGLGADQQRHRDLGQVVEDEHVDVAVLDELGGRELAVAPETGGAADAEGVFAHADESPCEVWVGWWRFSRPCGPGAARRCARCPWPWRRRGPCRRAARLPQRPRCAPSARPCRGPRSARLPPHRRR